MQLELEVPFMCPFLFAAAVDTVVAPYYDEVYLHEWGVVMYAESTVSVMSRPEESLLTPWPAGPVCVDAPVIYLYGGEFDFSLTVRIPNGVVTAAWPPPDGAIELDVLPMDQQLSAITWAGMRTCCPYTTDRSAMETDEADVPNAVVGMYGDLWRNVESLILTRPSDGFMDRFLFYECRLEAGSLPMPLARPGEDETEVIPYEGPVLVFSKLANSPGVGIYTTPARDAWIVPPPAARMRSLTPGEAYGVFHDWAEGDSLSATGLKEPEILAMWGTWQPFFQSGEWHGTSLIVFPMPLPMLDRISMLELSTPSGYPVQYNRFFLGVVVNR
jgi:hypothetical protein